MYEEITKEANTGNIFTDTYYLKSLDCTNGKREFDINPLWNFINNSFGCFLIWDKVLEDLELYQKYLGRKREIWLGKDDVRSKQRKTLELERTAGSYL